MIFYIWNSFSNPIANSAHVLKKVPFGSFMFPPQMLKNQVSVRTQNKKIAQLAFYLDKILGVIAVFYIHMVNTMIFFLMFMKHVRIEEVP